MTDRNDHQRGKKVPPPIRRAPKVGNSVPPPVRSVPTGSGVVPPSQGNDPAKLPNPMQVNPWLVACTVIGAVLLAAVIALIGLSLSSNKMAQNAAPEAPDEEAITSSELDLDEFLGDTPDSNEPAEQTVIPIDNVLDPLATEPFREDTPQEIPGSISPPEGPSSTDDGAEPVFPAVIEIASKEGWEDGKATLDELGPWVNEIEDIRITTYDSSKKIELERNPFANGWAIKINGRPGGSLSKSGDAISIELPSFNASTLNTAKETMQFSTWSITLQGGGKKQLTFVRMLETEPLEFQLSDPKGSFSTITVSDNCDISAVLEDIKVDVRNLSADELLQQLSPVVTESIVDPNSGNCVRFTIRAWNYKFNTPPNTTTTLSLDYEFSLKADGTIELMNDTAKKAKSDLTTVIEQFDGAILNERKVIANRESELASIAKYQKSLDSWDKQRLAVLREKANEVSDEIKKAKKEITNLERGRDSIQQALKDVSSNETMTLAYQIYLPSQEEPDDPDSRLVLIQSENWSDEKEAESSGSYY